MAFPQLWISGPTTSEALGKMTVLLALYRTLILLDIISTATSWGHKYFLDFYSCWQLIQWPKAGIVFTCFRCGRVSVSETRIRERLIRYLTCVDVPASLLVRPWESQCAVTVLPRRSPGTHKAGEGLTGCRTADIDCNVTCESGKCRLLFG